MRALINSHVDPARVPAPATDARDFHAALPDYAPTPIHHLPALARDVGVAAVGVKDESNRLGLPAFKSLGASWAVERTLRERPGVRTLVAASAGNHGRAVAHVAAIRGLAAQIFLPARSSPHRRQAIAEEGAEVVVSGAYEDAVRSASRAGQQPDAAEIADVGASPSAHWVIDGYATLFEELDERWDLIVVPAGVGSLAAAAARHAAKRGAKVLAVEPETAACLTASLAAGQPTSVPTPGTSMAGLDCAEVSEAAWPTLRAGISGAVTISDEEARAAVRELGDAGLRIGDSGAAALAGLRACNADPQCADLRAGLDLSAARRILLLATEGATDPVAYDRALAPV